MKIFIAGSMTFAKEMLEAQKFLNSIGCETYVSPDTELCIEKPTLNMDEKHCFELDIMRACMDIQEGCDAILVLNHAKDKVSGYIGAHALMEMGLAYYLKQKIFLLHPIPPKEQVRHAQEVMHMKPIILQGDISKIKEHL
ncbi:MAG: hypothetical protein V1870_03460 [Candidatus Aenigmatarchaeota archaeon]